MRNEQAKISVNMALKPVLDILYYCLKAFNVPPFFFKIISKQIVFMSFAVNIHVDQLILAEYGKSDKLRVHLFLSRNGLVSSHLDLISLFLEIRYFDSRV